MVGYKYIKNYLKRKIYFYMYAKIYNWVLSNKIKNIISYL